MREGGANGAALTNITAEAGQRFRLWRFFLRRFRYLCFDIFLRRFFTSEPMDTPR